MSTLEELENNHDDFFDQEILNSATSDIINRTKLLDNDIKVMRPVSYTHLDVYKRQVLS